MKTSIEWIPCAERLPDDEALVLLAKDGECWLGWHDGDEWLADDSAPVRGVTHWAHLPEVPA
jgi:hypothetical protein